MADVLPFAAVMPPGNMAQAVASPPYDVMSADEARAMAQDNPLAFLRVGRAELELPAGTDPYDDAVYQRAAGNYRDLCSTAPLRPDECPRYYVYSLVREGCRQTGVVGCATVDDYDNGIVLKHEKTRPQKEDDRTRHILTVRSQTGPVFLTYRDAAPIDSIVAATMQADPRFDFMASDGVRHTGWTVPDSLTSALRAAFADVPRLYIADGHHRAAGAARARNALRDANSAHDGSEAYNSFLTVTFPASHLQILPYNRVVADLNGLTADELLRKARDAFTVSPARSPAPDAPGCVHMYLDGTWWALNCGGAIPVDDPVASLDVSLLQDRLLGPVLGIDDPRTSPRIDFVGGIRGTEQLERRVDGGTGTVAFAMVATTVEQLMAIADAGEIMPPKSTWFEPKLRDGLFCHDI